MASSSKYHNFWTYSVHGLENTAPDGFRIPFAAGHIRRCLGLPQGRSVTCVTPTVTLRWPSATPTSPVKQAVISPSALSLMYPADEIPGYSREEFIDDLLARA